MSQSPISGTPVFSSPFSEGDEIETTVPEVTFFLLLETGDKLLLESGDAFLTQNAM